MRHRWPTRLWHTVNVVVAAVMLMSGLMIFNAHPRLYWGEAGANSDYAWLEIGRTRDGSGATRIGSVTIATDGVLGQANGEARAFPGWATIPSYYSLADARLWHLAFAWLLSAGLGLYLVWGLASGHLRRAVIAGGAGYNRAQRIAYALVLIVALPGMVLTGLAMAPAMDAAWPWLTALAGRQSMRSLHFIGATGLLAFVLGHIALTLRKGPVRLIWGITLGRGAA